MPLFFPISYNKQLNDSSGMRGYVHKEATLPEMRFSINIPSSFTTINSSGAPPTTADPVTGCLFMKSGNGDVQVIVQCAHIMYEVSLMHYYQYMAGLSGETIVEKRMISNNEDKPDLLSRKTFADGQTWITRRTGYKIWNGAGAFVITVNVAVNMDHYTQYAELMFAISGSLQPAVKPEWTLAERLLLVSRRYPVDFATYIPVSWKEYHHHSDTVDEMNLVYTKTLRKGISGMLSMCCVAVYKVGGRDAVLQKCHKGYLDQGADLSGITTEEAADINTITNVIKGSIDFQQPKQQEPLKNNITFYLAKKGNNWIYLEMFGPARETDYESWAMNDRAFEIMKERLVSS